MSVIVPAPTVRPPSRIANREPFSMATGVMSSAEMLVLSPGITISTPSGRFNEPVTSVVRVELRAIAVKERRVPSAFFLGENVDLRLELRVRGDRATFGEHLTALDFVFFRAAQ